MTTTVQCTKIYELSYPNLFHALYQAVRGDKQELDLIVIQKLFQSCVGNGNTVTINGLNQVKLGLTFTFDDESNIFLDASKYEANYGTNTASLTLDEYKKDEYIDPENSCKLSDLLIEKQDKIESLESKRTVNGTITFVVLAILSLAYLKTQ